MDFTLVLNEQLYAELIDGCRECNCSPKQFAAESLESVLASRRLPRVALGAQGARIGKPDVEDAEPEGYPVRLEQMI